MANMEEITREQAEQLISNSEVSRSDIEQSGGELRVKFQLKNNSELVVVYTPPTHRESYFFTPFNPTTIKSDLK